MINTIKTIRNIDNNGNGPVCDFDSTRYYLGEPVSDKINKNTE